MDVLQKTPEDAKDWRNPELEEGSSAPNDVPVETGNTCIDGRSQNVEVCAHERGDFKIKDANADDTESEDSTTRSPLSD